MHTIQEMAAVVTKLNLHFPRSGGLLNEQILSLAEDWAEDLSEFPMPVILQALKLCRRDERRKFFPTLGEFGEYCRVAMVEYKRYAHKQLPMPSRESMDAEDERNRLHGIDRMKKLYQTMGWAAPAPERQEPKRTPSVQEIVQHVPLSPELEAERARLVAQRDRRKGTAFQREAAL